MEYKELQNQAKELGLSYVGVSAEDLEKSIREANEKTEPLASIPHEGKRAKKTKEKSKVSKSGFNTAVVLDGTREVRRYDASEHGDDFVELANEFAGKRKYEVKLENVEAGIVCPKCGHGFRPKKVAA